MSLALSAVWAVLGLGVRNWLHRRATGRSAIRRGAGPRGSLAVVGVTLAFVVGPVDDLVFGESRLVHSSWLAGAGALLAALSIVVLLWSQASMGDSLRIGVDPSERTTLVTAGPFRYVRNPIYSTMFAYSAATAMLVPNAASIGATVLLVAGEEFQVRRIEEPYLVKTHGASYGSYASRVGRFIPLVGRMPVTPAA